MKKIILLESIALAIIVITTIAFIAILNEGYDRSMVKHCTYLQNQAIEYSSNEDYYITKADHDECKEVYNIEINAIVK